MGGHQSGLDQGSCEVEMKAKVLGGRRGGCRGKGIDFMGLGARIQLQTNPCTGP